jgi:uncharacterized Tic20 family protein
MAEAKKTPEASENHGGGDRPKQSQEIKQEQTSKESNKDARMWAMFCHLAGLAGLIIPLAGNVVGPLIIWQIKKDDFPFVDEQGKEAVNFQISMTIYAFISLVLSIICIGCFLLPAVVVVDFVFLLIAVVKANNGYHYRYPLCIRFIK